MGRQPAKSRTYGLKRHVATVVRHSFLSTRPQQRADVLTIVGVVVGMGSKYHRSPRNGVPSHIPLHLYVVIMPVYALRHELALFKTLRQPIPITFVICYRIPLLPRL